MTSPSPDIPRLIAAARERHAAIGIHLPDGTYDDDDRECVYDREDWPCPDRLLIDALVPVYEAAKQADAALQSEDGLRHGEAIRGGNVNDPRARDLIGVCAYCDQPWPCRTERHHAPLHAALRAALGEPNA